jgi:hypothetical protein
MAVLTTGMASSHAFTLLEPDQWDEGRENNRRAYERRYGVLPPVQPGVATEVENDADTRRRYGRVRDALTTLRTRLAEERPDALVMVADDQNENFTETNLPQIAVYVGDGFQVGRRGQAPGPRYPSHPALAETILNTCVNADIDMAVVRSLPDDLLMSHAIGPVLRYVDPEARIPVVPIFVNAIHMPAPSPARCWYLGQTIRRAIESHPGVERVAMYGSGGLSHYTGGYPWAHYGGSNTHGAIDVEFDHWLVGRMQAGDTRALAELTTEDLLDRGEIELRSWITTLGAIGDRKPDLLVYEPFYRGIMGMGVGAWSAQG